MFEKSQKWYDQRQRFSFRWRVRRCFLNASPHIPNDRFLKSNRWWEMYVNSYFHVWTKSYLEARQIKQTVELSGVLQLSIILALGKFISFPIAGCGLQLESVTGSKPAGWKGWMWGAVAVTALGRWKIQKRRVAQAGNMIFKLSGQNQRLVRPLRIFR